MTVAGDNPPINVGECHGESGLRCGASIARSARLTHCLLSQTRHSHSHLALIGVARFCLQTRPKGAS
jgi:hypothetical protein